MQRVDSALNVVVGNLKILTSETFQELQDELKGASKFGLGTDKALGRRPTHGLV